MRVISATILVIGVAFGASTHASVAAGTCSVQALLGQYVFTHRGFIDPGDRGVPRLHYGALVFDGAGKFSGKQSSSRGGVIGREKLAGTYTLAADCSGTVTMMTGTHRPTHWDLYVTEDHKRGHMIRVDAGAMAVRNFEK